MSQKGYPAIEWLKRIKDQELRAKALQAVEDAPQRPELVVDSLEWAIRFGIYFKNTKDGESFWWGIISDIVDNKIGLLPFPNESREQAKEVLDKFVAWYNKDLHYDEDENLRLDATQIPDFLNETYPE